MSDRNVLILAGATASGKTELSIELAQRFDAEVVGADSRQIYRGMPIGTAAPTHEQLNAVAHHLTGFLDPQERYSAARFTDDALDAIAAIRKRGKRAIVAGGTGFYIRALRGGFALAPQYDDELRARLAREAQHHEPDFLYDWLTRRNPERARAIGRRDTYRVLRALEVSLGSGPGARATPLRTFATEGYAPLVVFLDVPLPVLDERIGQRARRMIADGLLDEAERIGEDAVAANAVGYPQATAYLRGWSSLEELELLLARATRRYARRQRAWFRSEPSTLWCEPGAVERLVRENLGWSEKRA